MDRMGPFQESLGENKFCLKHKNEAFQTFKEWVAMIERRFETHVASIQTDREVYESAIQNVVKKERDMP